MKTKLVLSLFILLISIVFLPTPARADGIIIPDPCEPGPCPPPPCLRPGPCPPMPPIVQLAIRYHRVSVTIEDQIAITHVDQVFFNPNEWTVEGTYIFPLPLDATVNNFVLWIDGKPVEGKVLDATQARQTYEDIVRRMRDPALLEYIGRGAVQARIFPIPPKGERRIELEYTQALTAENGLVRYIYPLNTEKFSAIPLETVSVSVDVRSRLPIRAVYSPTHPVDVTRESDTHIRAGYEAQNITPDSDFALYYSLGESEAFHVLSYRDPTDADPDGFFLLLLAPSIMTIDRVIPKDVILVLDRSGSMEGEKFHQAQDALLYVLQHLNSEDRFNVIAFSTGLESYAASLRPASEVTEAQKWVSSLNAGGSTDINRALLEAASMVTEGVAVERPTYLIFLTDGLPTEGVIESQQILDNFSRSAPESLRLFAFGVGYDVDTFLLDSLAQAHHGSSTYVLPEERLDEILSTFYAKISTPVLTDLSLDFGDLQVYDLYPDPLPDLFRGSQLIVVGRYREGGATTLTLAGKVNGEWLKFVYPDQFFVQTNSSYLQSAIPRLWATRKIGYLLNQIRLRGPNQETIDQIVKLSIRYGIVTPYTSYLVTEDMPLGAVEQERIAADQYNQLLAMPTEVSGAGAVQKAAEQGALSQAEVVAAPPAETANRIRIIGARTFVFKDEVWTDTAFDPATMETVKIAFLSDDYFTLSQAHPSLAAAFALGQKVIALSEGIAYEVVGEGTPTTPIEIPPTSTPTPQSSSTSTPAPPSSPSPAPPNSPAPRQPSCLAGLLPLILLPAGFVLLRKRR
jgi:Ca-activated chloride channel family protein